MRNNSQTITAVFLVLTLQGCATRDSSEFRGFHDQTLVLGGGTAEALESALLFTRKNLVEAISEGNSELLDDLVLEREDVFTLAGDSATMQAALSRALRDVKQTTSTIGVYTMLLAELTDSTGLAFSIIDAGEPYIGVFATATAVLIEQGRIEHDSRRMHQAMQTAVPAVESIATAMAELTIASANAVQAAYADMAARRQRAMAFSGATPAAVQELIALNTEAALLLEKMRTLRDSWLLVPVIHSELMNSLIDVTASSTLRVLTERMLTINPKVTAGY
jgi:hypothetical protein